MISNGFSRHLPLGLAFLLFGIIAGCGPTLIESTRCDKPVTIDGIDTGSEWENAQYTFDDKKVTLGLMHDDSCLYLRLSTRDRTTQARVIMGGLTVWFNTTGKKDKVMGIRYPVPVTGRGMAGPPPSREEGEDEGEGEDSRQTAPDDQKSRPESTRQMMVESLTSVEILGSEEDDVTSMSCGEADSLGVLVRIAFTKGNLIYELRIPRQQSEKMPYAIGSSASEFVGIGFETGKVAIMERTPGGRQGGGQGPRGGMGGGMGGMGGGMGGMGGRQGGGPGGAQRGGQSQTPEKMELWLKAELADTK